VSVLENTRHEAFAQNLAKGMSQTQAYIEAGYTKAGADRSASRLLGNAEVAARVNELKERSAVAVKVTLDLLLEEGLGLMRDARNAQDYGAASATLERLAKLSGNWVDKRQVIGPTLGELLDAVS